MRLCQIAFITLFIINFTYGSDSTLTIHHSPNLRNAYTRNCQYSLDQDGKTIIMLNDNEYYFNRPVDLLLHFNDEKRITDKPYIGNYRVNKKNLLFDSKTKMLGKASAKFQQKQFLVLKPNRRSLFNPNKKLKDFTIEFRLKPLSDQDRQIIIEKSTVILERHANKLVKKQIGFQTKIVNKRLVWEFHHIFHKQTEPYQLKSIPLLRLSSSEQLNLNKWQHHTLTYHHETGKLTYYINAKEKRSLYATKSGKPEDPPLLARFSSQNQSMVNIGKGYHGFIDEMMISKICKTPRPAQMLKPKYENNNRYFNIAKYTPLHGIVTSQILDLGKTGVQLKKLTSKTESSETSSIQIQYRMSDHYFTTSANTKKLPWNYIKLTSVNVPKSKNNQGRFFQWRAILKRGSNGNVSPILKNLSFQFKINPLKNKKTTKDSRIINKAKEQSKNPKINIEDINGFLDIFNACETGQKEFVMIWINQGLNINQSRKTRMANTPLHLASSHGHIEIVKILIKNGANINAQNRYGDSPLHYVLNRTEHETIAKYLIDQGANVNLKNRYRETPLHCALRSYKDKTAKYLIIKGADINTKSKYGTPLYIALGNGRLKIADYLIDQGVNTKEIYKKNNTALHIAIKKGYQHIAKKLIHKKVDINFQDAFGYTPLHLALKKDQPIIAKYLIDQGANIHIKTNYGETPLHLALKLDQQSLTRNLIAKGADINAKNKDGEFPLILALEYDQLDIANLLIKKGSMINGQNRYHETPLHLASKKGCHLLAKVLFDKVVLGKDTDLYGRDSLDSTLIHAAGKGGLTWLVDDFLKKGFDINSKNSYGYTPLHFALENNQAETAGFLINKGADLGAKTKDGTTPAHLLFKGGFTKLVYHLINKGELNKILAIKNCYPLHYASEKGHSDLVKLLLDQNLNLNAKDKAGNSPLHLASKNGQLEIVSILMNNEALIHSINMNGDTLIYLAKKNNHQKIEKILLKEVNKLTASSKSKTNPGIKPLHLAIAYGQQQKAKSVINNGSNVNAKIDYALTPLHLAAKYGHQELARLLIQKGANIKAKTKDGRIPLHFALKERHDKLIKFLIKKGSPINIRDNNGFTPLQFVIFNNRYDDKHKLVKLLVEKGADINSKVIKGRLKGKAPLHMALDLMNYPKELANYLILKGADINIKDEDGFTPLLLAMITNSKEIAKILIDKGANVNAVVEKGYLKGYSVLHFAVSSYNTRSLIKLLLKKGAKVNVKNSEGKSPIDFAKEYGLKEIEKLLMKRIRNK